MMRKYRRRSVIKAKIQLAETPLIYGNLSVSLVHVTQFTPRETMVIPIIPPTQLWVVLTGISKYEAVTNHTDMAARTHIQPYMSIAGSSSKHE